MTNSDAPPAPQPGAPKDAGVAKHYLNYLGGNILVLLAGFVSFPILTRLLDNHEYGVLGYYDTWWLLLAAVLKLGAQQSILYFWPHGKAKSDPAFRRFTADFVLWPGAIAGVLWLLALIGFMVMLLVSPPVQSGVALCVLLLLPGTTLISFVDSALTAEQRSGMLVARRVVVRWAELACTLLIVWLVERSALGAYASRVVVTFAYGLWCFNWLRREMPVDWRAGDAAGVKAGLVFGLPLVANEISHVLVAFADRFVLKHLLGSFEPVGIYTIGYALAVHVNFLLRYTLQAAFNQVATRAYDTGGAAEVVRLKRSVMHVLTFAVAAIGVGAGWVGDDLLVFLAGPDKASSGPIFQWIAVTYVAYALIEIAGYGLLLEKRSGLTFVLTLGSLVVNLALNFALIPRYGVMGAVYATVAAYVFLGVSQYVLCPRALRALPGWRAVGLAGALALATHAVASATDLFHLALPLARFVAMAVLVTVTFVLPAVLIDRELRQLVRQRLLRAPAAGVA